MSDKVIELNYSQKEIVRRLSTVLDGDERAQKFYEDVSINLLGKLTAAGIAMIFAMGIYKEYADYSPMIVNLTYKLVPLWIDALDMDLEVADAAKALFNKAVKAS